MSSDSLTAHIIAFCIFIEKKKKIHLTLNYLEFLPYVHVFMLAVFLVIIYIIIITVVTVGNVII